MKTTFAIFNATVMVTVFAIYFTHKGGYTYGTHWSAISIGLLVGAVVAGIVYVTVGKNLE